jgi:hypothetical protein
LQAARDISSAEAAALTKRIEDMGMRSRIWVQRWPLHLRGGFDAGNNREARLTGAYGCVRNSRSLA